MQIHNVHTKITHFTVSTYVPTYACMYLLYHTYILTVKRAIICGEVKYSVFQCVGCQVTILDCVCVCVRVLCARVCTCVRVCVCMCVCVCDSLVPRAYSGFFVIALDEQRIFVQCCMEEVWGGLGTRLCKNTQIEWC